MTVETDDLPEAAEVRGDHLLEVALTEVLENAIEHADTDRPTVAVTIDAREERTTVTVAGNGPSVPDELGESVFEMAKYGPGGGAGIGLFLVRSVLDRCGGEIGVADNDPTGARFSLRFPAM